MIQWSQRYFIASDEAFFKPTYELHMSSRVTCDPRMVYAYRIHEVVVEDLTDDSLSVTVSYCPLLNSISITISDSPKPILEEAFKLTIGYISTVTDIDLTTHIDELLPFIRSTSEAHVKVNDMDIRIRQFDTIGLDVDIKGNRMIDAARLLEML